MRPDRIEREIFINAPVTRVWAVITEAPHMGTWFGDAGATIDLRPGGAMTVTWKARGTTYARVERVEPPHVFSYRWLRGRANEDLQPTNSTLVEFTLVAEGEGTRLRVVESGLRHLVLPEPELSEYIDKNTRGWTSELNELVMYLAGSAA